MTSSYYRGAHGVILVYDITRKETFDHLKDWMNELETYSNIQDSVKMIVGNKLDKDSDRQVSRNIGIEYAKSIGALFSESSAKSNVYVKEAFDELVLKILEHPTLIESVSLGKRQKHLLVTQDTLEQNQCSC